jgi:unsaturated rhamnogalacturonyl hydrolase
MKAYFAITSMLLLINIANAQTVDNTVLIVRKVADKILADTKLEFEGVYDNTTYQSYKEIPDTATVKFKTQYGNWHYSNGVLNLAMLNLGDFFKEVKYTQYTLNHIQFGFDNYKWFQQHFMQDRPHHKYPFGELWTMDELDDFGAMGASVMEAYQLRKDTQYKAYCDKAANHLLKNRLRMEDGTWIRKFPQANTLWADDLYMGVSFLSRMGKYTGNNLYFDDAIRQVVNFTHYLWDTQAELFYHCYYTAQKRNGLAHWGRCNGWILLAQIHLLKMLPAGHLQQKWLVQNIQKQIAKTLMGCGTSCRIKQTAT